MAWPPYTRRPARKPHSETTPYSLARLGQPDSCGVVRPVDPACFSTVLSARKQAYTSTSEPPSHYINMTPTFTANPMAAASTTSRGDGSNTREGPSGGMGAGLIEVLVLAGYK
ncbi:hypothetical protein CONLIGDRAFT_224385 [Coniochaeta ligniaria NRRL 30616]|uniref:Uncharacterized protein n=1 Tax=Coniochaeta ligniaria NRRL 30616 TaxID=1408157 RepID=A0A1J7IZQ8_9PEZI|nr:hypothetical protein CONLIGDRAFT_224385 [Coniochaeta ligniaria NRRL 30616]